MIQSDRSVHVLSARLLEAAAALDVATVGVRSRPPEEPIDVVQEPEIAEALVSLHRIAELLDSTLLALWDCLPPPHPPTIASTVPRAAVADMTGAVRHLRGARRHAWDVRLYLDEAARSATRALEHINGDEVQQL
jgi:hypothetical protein